jgi:hypothetical protein
MTPKETERLAKSREAAARLEARKGWARSTPDHPMVDFDFALSPEAKDALDRFAKRKPFKLTPEKFREAVERLYRRLARAYKVPAPAVVVDPESSESSAFYPRTYRIVLRGKPSVLAALHEFMHVRGFGCTAATWWSVNAFRLTFPAAWRFFLPTEGSHVLKRSKRAGRRTPNEVERQWRAFYVARQTRQAAAERAAQRAAAPARGGIFAPRTETSSVGAGVEDMPENLTAAEARMWGRLLPDARRIVAERAAARARAQAPAAPTGWTPTPEPPDPGVKRFELVVTEVEAVERDETWEEAEKREALERQNMIDAGFMDADGNEKFRRVEV